MFDLEESKSVLDKDRNDKDLWNMKFCLNKME